jgi:preprotein translocase subunit YajC
LSVYMYNCFFPCILFFICLFFSVSRCEQKRQRGHQRGDYVLHYRVE